MRTAPPCQHRAEFTRCVSQPARIICANASAPVAVPDVASWTPPMSPAARQTHTTAQSAVEQIRTADDLISQGR